MVYLSSPKMEAGFSEAFVPCCENFMYVSLSLLQLLNHSYEKVQICVNNPTVSMWLYQNKINVPTKPDITFTLTFRYYLLAW
jgi:hypothetical protein